MLVSNQEVKVMLCNFVILCVCVSGLTFVNSEFCEDRETERNIDVSQLFRRWYMVQKVHHFVYAGKLVNRTESSCPIITISEDYPILDADEPTAVKNVKASKQSSKQTAFLKKYLVVHLNQDEKHTRYHMEYIDEQSGFWLPSPENDPTYNSTQQYPESLQIVYGRGDFLSLTFCYMYPQKMYSLILSKKENINRADIDPVYKAFYNRQIDLGTVFEDCTNGNGPVRISKNMLILLTVFSVYWLIK